MDLLNETVLLKTKCTLFNLLIRETSQFLCYERLLNMTNVAYNNAFSAKCNSGRIAIQWFHIKHYLDYQYTKFQPYTFRVQKMCVFARYATLVPRLLSKMSIASEFCNVNLLCMVPLYIFQALKPVSGSAINHGC